MKRFVELVAVLFLSAWISGCVTAKQRAQEQEELERSIHTTSDPAAVKGCSFIMILRPDGIHATPEAQVASLVIPKAGVSWVVLDRSSGNELYSCSQNSSRSEQQAEAPQATPEGGPRAVETKAEAPTPIAVETKAPPAQPTATPEVVPREQPEAKIEPSAPAGKSASMVRITNNPEAVKGCRFLGSFARYQTVASFQEDVAMAGGNLGYIVAANKDGDVIGESYLCSEEAKP